MKMAKLGKPYENLVALVAKALHQGATVDVGQWLEGPDGTREIDVSVRGQIDEKETFILVECKDWKKNVGIAEIDALDSKRRDLGADKTLIVSNSGFTARALRKAERKGIMCVSALAAGDDIVRFVVNREFFAKKLSVEQYSWTIYGIGIIPKDLKIEELEYDSKNFAAWLRDRSKTLLEKNEFASTIHHRILFKQSVPFVRLGEPLPLRGIDLRMSCRRSWLVQTIKEDVSHGLYDHLKKQVLIPHKEFWFLDFDNSNWQEVALEEGEDIEFFEPPLGEIVLKMVIFNLLFKGVHTEAPPLDQFVEIEETIVEPATSEAPTAKFPVTPSQRG
jgi:Restriction endonuclease